MKIIYFCKEEENILDFDSNESLLLLKYFISNNSKIDIEKYNIFYGEKILNESEDKTKVRDIIKEDKFPIFHLKYREKQNSLETSMIKPKGIKEKYNHIVQLENFPSRPEIFSFFETFLANSYIKEGYYYLTEGSALKFYFKLQEHAYSFMKIMLDKKISNPIYEKLKVYLFIEDNENAIGKKRTDSMNKYDSIQEQPSIFQQDYNYAENKFHSVKQKKKNPKINTIKDTSLQSSSPYITESERMRKEYIENKKNWIGEDFSGCINTNKYPRYIQNYVNMSPSVSPLKYKFREENKIKWVGQKNFWV